MHPLFLRGYLEHFLPFWITRRCPQLRLTWVWIYLWKQSYGGKYYVADINYQNYSIRVVDLQSSSFHWCILQDEWISISFALCMENFLSGFGFWTDILYNTFDELWAVNQRPQLHSHYSMQHDRLFLFLITNILLCNSRRIRVRGRYAVFLHHQHIHGYSAVEGTSRVHQSFHVRFARLSASGASAFIFASLLQQPMQNERGKFATIQLWMRIPFPTKLYILKRPQYDPSSKIVLHFSIWWHLWSVKKDKTKKISFSLSGNTLPTLP